MAVDCFTFLLDAGAEPKARIQIAKLGDFKDPRYGEFSITAAEVRDWAANLAKLPGGRAPIDFDHAADKPGAARDTEAAGWITGVSLADGVPVADVQWTDKGREAIENQRYLFFSPTYGPWSDEKGDTTPNVLQGGALTNKPFLNMPTVSLSRHDVFAAEIAPEPTPAAADSRPSMAELTPKILDALGVADDADEAKILSAIQDKTTPGETKTLEAQAAEQGKVLLDATTLTKLQSDAAQGVAAAETLRVQTFETAFSKALSEGRVGTDEDTKALHRGIYDANADLALKNLAALPKIVNTSAQGTGGHTPEQGSVKLDGFEVDTERQVLLERAEAYAAEHNVDIRAAVLAVQEA